MYKLSEIKITYIVFFLLLASISFDVFINQRSLSNDNFWNEVLRGYYYFVILLVFLLFIFWKKGLRFCEVVGTFNRKNLPFALEVVFFNIIVSYSTIYIIFYPLSFAYPNYIYEWLSSGPIIFYTYEGGYPLLPNFLMAILMVIFVPIIEELVFRGILINRLSVTFKTKTAVIISSILFGVLHTDPLSATLFGVVMAMIYIQTQKLIIPIICHCLNNLAAYVFIIVESMTDDTPTSDAIVAFQDSWLIGLFSIITLMILSLIYLKRGRLYNKLYA
ncbi:CPBP family intramembrane glutamic endopeptidase [Photobacterium kishitanii]|uniref:CPBP family intramembrane glutamic endopeptidase n=2 Tax=Photobacterium kishitanii TaxID=318456 RepID=UPI000D164256|nr:type II CAAX endopeptidase family protein [Photobacterium kishitanii]PSU24403.1 hypothetical protein CTM84_01455 [Photobacterium kishitanii]PSW48891.1 hypothetical protein C0W66_12225 [Photobacterium kishitanii]